MNEILLYSTIYSYTATEFVTALGKLAADEKLVVRINGGGGEPTYGWAMVAKYLEHTGHKFIKVDGAAHSMYAFMLCYSDDSEAIDVSEFLIHRAAYPDWIENNPDRFTDSMRSEVERCNVFLRKAFEAKVDKEKFEKIAGVTIADIFSMDQRLEVTLTAKQAKEVGLINRVVTITPKRQAAIKSLTERMAAQNIGVKIAAAVNDGDDESENEIPKTKNMTIDELKAENRELYNKIVARGVNKERKRVTALLVYQTVDAKAVTEAIIAGKAVDPIMMAEMSLKMGAGKIIEKKKDENGKEIETEEPENKTAEQKQTADFTASVENLLKIPKA